MRSQQGYSGPTPHWWQDCLYYTGPGLDWRYEGILQGYLCLYEKTRQERWLAKARQAGDDLLNGQLPCGNFRNSEFEHNPGTGGTPHEAACDLALLKLAQALKAAQRPGWQAYLQAAERNLRGFVLDVLWDRTRRYFWNTSADPAFTPNKSATIVEALLAWLPLAEEVDRMSTYILPTLDAILDCQAHDPGGRLDGAIDQGRGVGQVSGRYFPLYIARCIPALAQGYEHTGQERYLEAARRALGFILRQRLPDGSFPQVVYANGRENRYPQWIAGSGDILRAMEILKPYMAEIDPEPTLAWLLAGRLPSGGVRTAHGFARRGVFPARSPLPDFRDVLPACGWVDKAFRTLCACLPAGCQMAEAAPQEYLLDCLFRGRPARFHESAEWIEVIQNGKAVYRWQKGAPWAETSLA